MSAARSVVRGVAAGALGTLAMDTELYRRYRRGGGEKPFVAWESSDGIESWDTAPAPARVGKLLLERATGRAVTARHARTLNNTMHWALGLAAGAGYGLAFRANRSKARYGLPLGAAVWANGYAVLPRLGVYDDIWKYGPKTLRRDLSAHLLFGATTAAAFSLMTTPTPRSSR